MRVYIQVKQLGKRKCCIEKLPVDFSVPPTNVQELIASIVSWQVSEYNDRLQQSEVNYNGRPAAETEAIVNALQSYEDGIFRIFIDDTEAGGLSSPVVLKEETTLTFIRLTMLSGRLW